MLFRVLTSVIFLLSVQHQIFSQSVDSTVHNGNWSDPAIWSKGALPSLADCVVINHNIHLDMDVTIQPPGKLYITKTGELCGNHTFKGGFINYGPIKVDSIIVIDSSISYGQFVATKVAISFAYWLVTPPGYGCVGCQFTCHPIVPWQSPIADFGNTTTICAGKEVHFTDLSLHYPSFWSWSFPGGTPSASSDQNPVIRYNQPGVYPVTLVAGNSLGTDTVTKTNYITVFPVPILMVSPDITINYGDIATLTASGNGNYLWNTGSTDSSLAVQPSQTSSYTVTATNLYGCAAARQVNVNVEPCAFIYLPNAFSPNGDGDNDVLQLFFRNKNCVRDLHFSVFNRWGESVFDTTDRDFQWDGVFENSMLETSVLAYYLFIEFADGSTINKKGNISLIR